MSVTGPWVVEAIQTLGLGGRVRILSDSERETVLAAVYAAFLDELSVLFWWSHLKTDWSGWHTEHGYRRIPEIVPVPDAPSWFITGLTDNEKAVFECVPALVPALVGECPGFEYAVVDQALDRMVIENHHDILIATGAVVVDRLNRMRE
jgi:hypothetical protein